MIAKVDDLRLMTDGTMIDPDPTIAIPMLGPINLIVVFEKVPM